MTLSLHQARTLPSSAKGNLSNLKLLPQYLAPYKLELTGAAFALMMTSVSVLGLGKGLGYLVDKGFGEGGNPALLNAALGVLIALTIVLAIGTFARFYLITYVGECVIAKLRNAIYSHIIHLSPQFFETARTGDILSRITTDTALLQIVIGSSLSIALRNTVMLLGGMGLLLHSSPKLSMIVAIALPIVVTPILLLGKKLRALSRLSQEKVGHLTSHAEETIAGIKAIQSYTREAQETIQFENLVKQSLQTASLRILTRAFLTAMVIMLIFGSIGFVLWIGGQDVLNGKMSAGTLSSFIFYSVIVAGSTGAISEVFGDLQRASGALQRITELLSTHTDVASPEFPVALPRTGKTDIAFENVTFHYPTHLEKPSLHHINLHIQSGETLAIVGPSGAGKSTIFQLLCRFYDVHTGSITIEGVGIKKLSLFELRNLFGLVPQDPMIFSGTAYENITIGKPDASYDEVINAARLSAALPFIEALPEGFNSHLGEKGVRLSGGEKQRISIARAFLKDPKILLLDEATSALDSYNEALVQDALKKLMKGRTTLIIAHRFSTVQEADRIIVLNEGMVVEEGTHKKLMASKGLYAKLAKVGFE